MRAQLFCYFGCNFGVIPQSMMVEVVDSENEVQTGWGICCSRRFRVRSETVTPLEYSHVMISVFVFRLILSSIMMSVWKQSIVDIVASLPR
jgi:hypothetical protein